MTYKATERILYQAVDIGRLIPRYPLLPSAPVRRLFVTPEVNKILDGHDDKFKNLPMVETETIIGRFCAGHLVTVSLQGNPAGKPDFEKLQGLDEVWAICARKPKMWQVRIFGRFIAKGCFIGLGFYERAALGFRENYNAAASEVPALWNDVLGNCVRYDASTVSEYFGGVYRDVDE